MKTPVLDEQSAAAALGGSRAWPAWLGRRRALTLGGLGAVGAGFALNWDWLTAVGAAPVLVSLLPCAAMCALGLCMRGGKGGSCSSRSADGAGAAAPDASRARSLDGPANA